MMGRYGIACVLTVFFLSSCTAPPVTDEKASTESLCSKRAQEIRSVAYVIDLRFNDGGKKYSTVTELYFQGDSVGFYGRGYFGKGSFKGKIIDDTVTVYFPSQRQYFVGAVADSNYSEDCFAPRAVVPYFLSLLSGLHAIDRGSIDAGGRSITASYGHDRFARIVHWSGKSQICPKREELIDPCCGDTVVISYSSCGRHFPYYKPQDILYRNGRSNFEAKGFIRQQIYNQSIDLGRFTVTIPSSAIRIDSL